MSQDIYIVVSFGCNSTASDMWIPETFVFTDKEKAYECYHQLCPDLNDTYNRAEKKLGEKNCIESIVQIAGYAYGDNTCAKRPSGTSIYKHTITF